MAKCNNTNSNTTCPPPYSYYLGFTPLVVGRVPIPPEKKTCEFGSSQDIMDSIDADINITSGKTMGSPKTIPEDNPAYPRSPLGGGYALPPPKNTGSDLGDEDNNRVYIPDEVLIKTSAKRQKNEISNIFGSSMLTEYLSAVCNTKTSTIKAGDIFLNKADGTSLRFNSYQEARNEIGSSLDDTFNDQNAQDVFDNWDNLNTSSTVTIWTADEQALKSAGLKILERDNVSVKIYPTFGTTKIATATSPGGVSITANQTLGTAAGGGGRSAGGGEVQGESWTTEDISIVNDMAFGSATYLRGGLGLGINYMNDNGWSIDIDAAYSRNITQLESQNFHTDPACERWLITAQASWSFK